MPRWPLKSLNQFRPLSKVSYGLDVSEWGGLACLSDLIHYHSFPNPIYFKNEQCLFCSLSSLTSFLLPDPRALLYSLQGRSVRNVLSLDLSRTDLIVIHTSVQALPFRKAFCFFYLKDLCSPWHSPHTWTCVGEHKCTSIHIHTPVFNIWTYFSTICISKYTIFIVIFFTVYALLREKLSSVNDLIEKFYKLNKPGARVIARCATKLTWVWSPEFHIISQAYQEWFWSLDFEV